jgi:hypothetical protein
MEPEGSSSCPPEPAAGNYPEPDESSPQIPTLCFCDTFSYYPANYTTVTIRFTSQQLLNIFLPYLKLIRQYGQMTNEERSAFSLVVANMLSTIRLQHAGT